MAHRSRAPKNVTLDRATVLQLDADGTDGAAERHSLRLRARQRKTCRTRPWLRICSALKHRHFRSQNGRQRAAPESGPPNEGTTQKSDDAQRATKKPGAAPGALVTR